MKLLVAAGLAIGGLLALAVAGWRKATKQEGALEQRALTEAARRAREADLAATAKRAGATRAKAEAELVEKLRADLEAGPTADDIAAFIERNRP